LLTATRKSAAAERPLRRLRVAVATHLFTHSFGLEPLTLLAYYGDDFTGSTDALEQLVRGGVPTVLFVEPPTAEALARYPDVRAIGVAGRSRAMSPEQMEQALPAAFAALAELNPRFVHYKVCSTFDSSPEIGSVGRAIDLGCHQFENRLTPLVVGAPSLQRFCIFGNLFARSGLDSAPYRLDRHPTMRRHPVTPMDEADLRVHLSHQTSRPIALVDVLTIERGPDAAAARIANASPGDVVLLDVLTEAHLTTIGRLLGQLQQREQKPLFVVGSSGVDAALARYWQATGAAGDDFAAQPAVAAERVIVISGSCSPVTARQIGWALHHGFAEVAVDVPKLLDSANLDADLSAIANDAKAHHDQGLSVIVHTTSGARDGRVATHGAAGDSAKPRLGVMLGRILRDVLQSRRVSRVAVAGGDTAGDIARIVGIEALEMIGPLAPGRTVPPAVTRLRSRASSSLSKAARSATMTTSAPC
jgi:uncharacterized protein YgbK (DUF1537 family)